jgi:hypothetical protein
MLMGRARRGSGSRYPAGFLRRALVLRRRGAAVGIVPEFAVAAPEIDTYDSHGRSAARGA